MAYTVIRRRWRSRRPVWLLMPLELLAMIAVLILTGRAQPDTYRTKLWKVGYQWHLNSNPLMTLYADVNGVAAPHVPFRWSQTLTNFNVAVAVLTLFLLLSKLILMIMRFWFPIVHLVASLALAALYTTSVGGQAGPDYADPAYPSRVPWYLSRSCDLAEPWGGQYVGFCKMAKGTFAATVVMLAIYVAHTAIGIYNMIPSKTGDDRDYDDDPRLAPAEKGVELRTNPPLAALASPTSSPFTPRTQAFNVLSNKAADHGGPAYA